MTSLHPLTMAQCDDLPTPGQWLRALASNLALVASWRVALGVVAHLLVHVADIVHYLRRGQTAVLSPTRTGGGDHSLRAVHANRNPMLFGGEFTTGASCSRLHRHPRSPAMRIAITWTVARRRVLSARVTSRGYVVCYAAAKATQ